MTTHRDTKSIRFDGLRIELQRNGTAVTGRAHFPESSGKRPIPIDFKVKGRPAVNVSSATDPMDDRTATALASIAKDAQAVVDHRSKAVQKYHACIAATPHRNRLEIAEQIAKASGCSARAIQMWVRKASLGDTLVKPSSGAIDGDDDNIEHAIRVCAYWCYRIGNLPTIDTRHVRLALNLVQKHSLQDILAVIDFYFSYDCNRMRYPFKQLSNWLRYHFDTWFFRTCEAARTRQARDASAASASRARRVDVRSDGHWLRPPATAANSIDLADVGRAAKQASRMGLQDVASALTRKSSSETIDDALESMPDGFRRVVLGAVGGDRAARLEAIATLPMWYEYMPQSVRNNVDFRVDAWVRDHRPNKGHADARRVDMMVNAIRTRGKKIVEKIGH